MRGIIPLFNWILKCSPKVQLFDNKIFVSNIQSQFCQCPMIKLIVFGNITIIRERESVCVCVCLSLAREKNDFIKIILNIIFVDEN